MFIFYIFLLSLQFKMSVFKSAMGYFSSGGANGSDNDFVGQFVEIGNMKLRVKKVIAEGNTILDFYIKCILVYIKLWLFSYIAKKK